MPQPTTSIQSVYIQKYNQGPDDLWATDSHPPSSCTFRAGAPPPFPECSDTYTNRSHLYQPLPPGGTPTTFPWANKPNAKTQEYDYTYNNNTIANNLPSHCHHSTTAQQLRQDHPPPPTPPSTMHLSYLGFPPWPPPSSVYYVYKLRLQ